VALDVGAGAIPTQQCVHRETVPQIVQAWPSSIVRTTQAHLTRQLGERLLDDVDGQPAAVVADEKAGRHRPWQEPISLIREPLQSLPGTRRRLGKLPPKLRYEELPTRGFAKCWLLRSAEASRTASDWRWGIQTPSAGAAPWLTGRRNLPLSAVLVPEGAFLKPLALDLTNAPKHSLRKSNYMTIRVPGAPFCSRWPHPRGTPTWRRWRTSSPVTGPLVSAPVRWWPARFHRDSQ
jgi:hypothetical protein